METKNQLPSKVQIGDKVNLNLFDAGTVFDCIVIGINFTESSVYYDVEVEVKKDNSLWTTLSNISSNFIDKVEVMKEVD